MRTRWLLRINPDGSGLAIPASEADATRAREDFQGELVPVVPEKDYLAMKGRVQAKDVEVTLCADPGTGNDYLEADMHLPVIPRHGDKIEIPHPGGTTVVAVDLVVFAVDRVEVWIDIPGCYDLGELEEAMKAAKEGWRDE